MILNLASRSVKQSAIVFASETEPILNRLNLESSGQGSFST